MTRGNNILVVEDQFVEANHLRIMLKNAGYTVLGIAHSYDDAIRQIQRQKPDIVLLDIQLSGKLTGIDLARYLKEQYIGFIYLSANSNEEILNEAKKTQPYGFLVKPFREKDLLVALEIARYHEEYGLESQVRKEALLQQQLKQLSNKQAGWQESLMEMIRALQPLIPYDFAIAVPRYANCDMKDLTGFLRVGFREYQQIDITALQTITRLKDSELQSYFDNLVISDQVQRYTGKDFDAICKKAPMKDLIARFFDMKSNITLPVHVPASHQAQFYFSFFSKQSEGLTVEHEATCKRLQQLLDTTIELLLLRKNQPKSVPATDARDYNPVAAPQTSFQGIIGRSPLLLGVFDCINQVAGVDTTVLITGESGTGKERVAECIHELSPRNKKAMVKVNCAALPANLIESELFGHEKGAFTGAGERRIGKFEQAQDSTIFLDEIGELPLDMQSRLLRVLQQREIDRIGGNTPVRINVRVVAATNRNLEKEVAEGRFRIDLYYRLFVFPIQIPALRERKEDILVLTEHFMNVYSKKTGKHIDRIAPEAVHSLMAYHWPGNIRELENLIERCVLLTQGNTIAQIPLPVTVSTTIAPSDENRYHKTIEENEREHILAVLNQCSGRIRGFGGAAEILGVPPTTLASKMKKLGIKRAFKA